MSSLEDSGAILSWDPEAHQACVMSGHLVTVSESPKEEFLTCRREDAEAVEMGMNEISWGPGQSAEESNISAASCRGGASKGV